MSDNQRKYVSPVSPVELGIPPLMFIVNTLLNLPRTTAAAPAKRKHEGQRGRAPANQSLVSSKKSYNLKAPPTNPNTVTTPIDDGDLSSGEDVVPIKRMYFQNSISLVKGFPGSQNWVSKAVAVMKAFNLADTVDLLRELVCRQTKVAISSTPSIRILQELTTSPSSTPSPSSL